VRRLTARHPLARLRDERGAVAVMVALLMPILFGCAAIAIDTSAVWSARQQVETGADAAVIAVAMDCARGNCGDIKATSEAAMWANDKAAKVADLGPGIGLISVNNRKIDQTITTPWLVKHYFAAALGHDTGSLTVESHAAWAPATQSRAKVPLAVSRCTYALVKGSMSSASTTTLPLTTAVTPGCSAYGVSGPQGTALTAVDSGGGCTTSSTWKGTVAQYGSAGLPAGCTASYLAGLVGTDLVIPVFDSVTGSGSAQSFHVYGYAAFHVSAASTSGLTGWFTVAARQISATTPPDTTAPDLGARSVFLTKS
jgi:Flp pilus assembly protein TadG